MLNFKMKNTRFLLYVTFIFFILLVRIDARHKKHEKPKAQSPSPSPSPPSPPSSSGSKTINVMNYGAKGDGHTDDTQAFSDAWAVACDTENPVMVMESENPVMVMQVPSPGKFLVKPISFAGNCKSRMVFQLDGMIIASTNSKDWDSEPLQWLEFTKLNGGLIVNGTGTVDGKGDVWWTDNGNMPSTKPTAIRVADSYDVIVTGITIQNSQQTHLKFDSCVGVKVREITISSPADSPNTDGIHLQNSQTVEIHDNKIGCGDDCISIQTGCSDIDILRVTCGPSHGISIGSLGKDGSRACVKSVTVSDSTVTQSQNGVRIKTWQGGSGLVYGVSFLNIRVSEVDNAIVIDQNYCDGGCSKMPGAVAVHNVSFTNIQGSYDSYPVSLHCSADKPCTHITLSGINLSPSKNPTNPSCENAFGDVDDTEKCLSRDGPSSSPFYSSKQDSSDNGATC